MPFVVPAYVTLVSGVRLDHLALRLAWPVPRLGGSPCTLTRSHTNCDSDSHLNWRWARPFNSSLPSDREVVVSERSAGPQGRVVDSDLAHLLPEVGSAVLAMFPRPTGLPSRCECV